MTQRPNGVWYYRRRVPADLAHLDRRGFVMKTTKTRSPSRAAVIVERMNDETESFWCALAEGRSAADEMDRYNAAVKRARTLGVRYLTTKEVAALPPQALTSRLELLADKGLVGSEVAVTAILGGVDRPNVRISQLFDTYLDLVKSALSKKAPDQLRKWVNPRKKAIRNLITVVGDKPIVEITRGDVLDFRVWWSDRIEHERLFIGTANKDFGHLSSMFLEVEEKLRLDAVNPFSRMRLRGEENNRRIAYERSFVAEKILKPGALDGLNDEARAIVQIMTCTGMRPSEIVNLKKDTIRLDGETPYVSIQPDDRELKTDSAVRDMPLCGVALQALREHPEGFPRYHGKADTLSATVNKFFGEADLRPTHGHSLYSLRHTFKDRLIEIEAPERVQDDLMGHAVSGTKYGNGPSLDQKLRWMELVAF